jgi:uncharacterized membrane protein
MQKFAFLILILMCATLCAHEGEHPNSFWMSVGHLHFALVHFPIALITMTIVAEILSVWTTNILYDYASHFMLISAAILIVPTLIFGLILGYNLSDSYKGGAAIIYPWHLFFGCVTTVLVLVTTRLRVKDTRFGSLYPYFLILSFLSMSITGLLGGALSFGVGLHFF